MVWESTNIMVEDFWPASLNSFGGIFSLCWLLKDFPTKVSRKVFCWINMPLYNKNNTRQFNTTHTALSAELLMIQTAKLGQHSCAGATVPPRRGKTLFRVAQVRKWLKNMWEEMTWRLEDVDWFPALRSGQEHFQQKTFNEVGNRSRPRSPSTFAGESLRWATNRRDTIS